MILFPAIFARDDRHLRQEEHAAPDLLPPRARPLPLPEGRHPASDSRPLRKSHFHSGPIFQEIVSYLKIRNFISWF